MGPLKESITLPSDQKDTGHARSLEDADACVNNQKESRSRKEGEASFEKVLMALGSPGLYQVTQFILINLSMTLATSLIFSYVFIGYGPPHVCNDVNDTQLLTTLGLQNDSTAWAENQACETVVFTNRSGKEETVKKMSCQTGRNFSAPKHTSLLTEWDLVCESAGIPELVGTFLAVGQIVGGPIASVVSDRFGRKFVFVGCSVVACALEFGIIFAPNVLTIMILRLFNGVFYKGLVASGLILAMELRTPAERTFYGVMECVVWVFTTLLIVAVAYATQDYGWRGYQTWTAVTGLIFPIYFLFVYESPRWLTVNDRNKEALDILRIACKQNSKGFSKVQEEYNAYVFKGKRVREMDEHDTNAMKNRRDFFDFRQITELLCQKRITVIISCLSFAYLTHDLIYYGMFMMSSSLAGDRFLNFCLMTLTEIPSNLVLFAMMPRMGRRTVIAIFLSIASASLLVCSFMASFAPDISSYGTVSLVFFLIGKLAITSSYNALYIYTPEIFPTNIRTVGATLCSSVGRIGLLLVPYMRPFYDVVMWGPAVTFSAMSGVTLLLIPMLPEMKGVNLNDAKQDFTGLETKTTAKDSGSSEQSL